MATKTLGTLATSTLTGVQCTPSVGAVAAADVASIANNIFYDPASDARGNVASSIFPGAFSWNGLLYIPGRGVLRVLPGDWVGYDTSGFPYLVPARSLPKTLTIVGSTNTNTTINGLASSAITAGWQVGAPITGTNVPTSTVITAIAAGGLSLTISKAATGSGSGITFTVGSWTHN